MKLLRFTSQNIYFNAGSVATIGNFDGVHRGHQALLALLRQQADARQLPLLVILFESQPGEYFKKNNAPARLYSLREKLCALSLCGVDYVCCLKFDKHLAQMPALAFAERFIFTQFNVSYLLVGDDFRFGYQRLGDLDLLRQLGRTRGLSVDAYPDFCIDQARISSTQIRHALYLGDLALARALMGRAYTISGRVKRGQGLGRQWGVPTANISVHRGTLPLSGVFCVQVKRQGRPLLLGIANIGNRPTVDGRKNVLEIHLFDFDESLYGEMIQVIFLHKLRDEFKFPSVDALIAQIHADVVAAREIFRAQSSLTTLE